MSHYTLEEFHSNPALQRRLFDMARRERNLAVRAGLDWLRKHLAPQFHVRAPRWIARLG